jgi:hypothetical protein
VGFVYEPARIVIDFDTPGVEGLQLVSRPISVGTLLQVEKLGDDTKDRLPEAVSAMTLHLISWNVETPAGDPVPISTEWLMSTDVRFLLSVLKGWIRAVSGRVGDDLGKDSTDGENQEVLELLQMANSSPSPSS